MAEPKVDIDDAALFRSLEKLLPKYTIDEVWEGPRRRRLYLCYGGANEPVRLRDLSLLERLLQAKGAPVATKALAEERQVKTFVVSSGMKRLRIALAGVGSPIEIESERSHYKTVDRGELSIDGARCNPSTRDVVGPTGVVTLNFWEWRMAVAASRPDQHSTEAMVEFIWGRDIVPDRPPRLFKKTLEKLNSVGLGLRAADEADGVAPRLLPPLQPYASTFYAAGLKFDGRKLCIEAETGTSSAMSLNAFNLMSDTHRSRQPGAPKNQTRNSLHGQELLTALADLNARLDEVDAPFRAVLSGSVQLVKAPTKVIDDTPKAAPVAPAPVIDDVTERWKGPITPGAAAVEAASRAFAELLVARACELPLPPWAVSQWLEAVRVDPSGIADHIRGLDGQYLPSRYKALLAAYPGVDALVADPSYKPLVDVMKADGSLEGALSRASTRDDDVALTL